MRSLLTLISTLFSLPIPSEPSDDTINENLEILTANTWFHNTLHFNRELFLTDKEIRKLIGDVNAYEVLNNQRQLNSFRADILHTMGVGY